MSERSKDLSQGAFRSLAEIITEAKGEARPSPRQRLNGLVAELDGQGILFPEFIASCERAWILNVLHKHRGNQCAAANELKMHRNTLSRRLQELGLLRKGPRTTGQSQRLANLANWEKMA